MNHKILVFSRLQCQFLAAWPFLPTLEPIKVAVVIGKNPKGVSQ